jgi:tetratricopeptide (TPR) repeat protein
MNMIIGGRSAWKWRSSQCRPQALAFFLAFSVLALGLSADASSLCAQSKAPVSEYQQLIDRGLAAYQAQRPAEARSLFAQAHALQPGARTLRALGIADLALDNYTMAKDELEAALSERVLPLSDSQRAEVRDLLRWMQGNLGTLHLSFSPLHAEAKIDGRPVTEPKLLLAPEEHRLTISAHGFVPQERTFTITVDRPMRLSVSLERAPTKLAPIASQEAAPDIAPAEVAMNAPEASTASNQTDGAVPVKAGGAKLWPWLGGAGAVLLVAGATMFAFGMSDKAAVENAEAPVRLSEIQAAHDRVPWLTGIGVSVGAVGLAGIGTAAFLLLTQREPRADVAWSLDAGPTQLSMTRRF